MTFKAPSPEKATFPGELDSKVGGDPAKADPAGPKFVGGSKTRHRVFRRKPKATLPSKREPLV